MKTTKNNAKKKVAAPKATKAKGKVTIKREPLDSSIIPMLTSKRVIGQTSVVRFINDEIANANWHTQRGLPYMWKAKLLGGPSGTGKGTIVEAFQEVCFPHEQYLVMPANGGIGDFKSIMNKIASVNPKTNAISAIPAVVFYDECHEMNDTVANNLKLIINKPIGQIERTGATYYHNQHVDAHKIFFASNEVVDKAIIGRCDKLETTYYSKAEIAQHVRTFLHKPCTQEVLDYVVDRAKPEGRLVQNIVDKLDQQGTDKLTIEHARKVVRDMFGLNPGGIETKDMALMKRLCQGAAIISVLQWAVGDNAKKLTQARCDWLAYLGFIESAKHNGYCMTKKGLAYYDDTIAKIKAQKAAAKK